MATPIETRKFVLLATLSIPNAGTDSPVLVGDVYRAFGALCIMAPAALTNGITVQVATTDIAAPTFATLQSPPGTDIAIAAGKAVVLTAFPFAQFRIHSAGAEGTQRDFQVWGQLISVTSP